MFYDEKRAISDCEKEPALIFDLIKRNRFDLVDKVLSKGKIDINKLDSAGNDIITKLLKVKQYDLVLKYMKNKDWDINRQDNDGNTFAHHLVSINYVHVVDIIKSIKRRKDFIPNIKNNKGETILDKSINENYIYTTLKILEDKRFNNIDVVSFKKVFNAYIKSSYYGKYSKINNLQIIVGSLEKKESLLPNMRQLVDEIKDNMDQIKEEIMSNKSRRLEKLIKKQLVEVG